MPILEYLLPCLKQLTLYVKADPHRDSKDPTTAEERMKQFLEGQLRGLETLKRLEVLD